jgi:hypothetical protein
MVVRICLQESIFKLAERGKTMLYFIGLGLYDEEDISVKAWRQCALQTRFMRSFTPPG